MSAAPAVSVVLATRNQARWLDDAIASVLLPRRALAALRRRGI